MVEVPPRSSPSEPHQCSYNAPARHLPDPRRLRAANGLDFDDLLGLTVALLRDSPGVADQLRTQFSHVLVGGCCHTPNPSLLFHACD